MVPTPRARELATQITPGLANLRHALNDRAAFDPGNASRHFTLGLSDIGSFEVLPLLMPDLRRTAPGISLEVADVSAQEAVAKLHMGEIDLALNAFPDLPADLLSQPLSPLKVVCIADRSNPYLKNGALDLDGFLNAPHVAIGSPSSTVTPPDFSLNAMGIRRRIVLHVPHFLAIPGAILGTDMIAIFDAHAAMRFSHLPDLLVVDPPVPLQTPTALMIWHPRSNNDAGHLWLRNTLQKLHKNQYATQPAQA
jgi:DNA-binding transcriptional LysR family regulator